MKQSRTVFIGILLATSFAIRAAEAGSLPVAAAATFQANSVGLSANLLTLDAGALNNHIDKLTNRMVAGFTLPAADPPLQAAYAVQDDSSPVKKVVPMSGYEKWLSLTSGAENIMTWSGMMKPADMVKDAAVTPGGAGYDLSQVTGAASVADLVAAWSGATTGDDTFLGEATKAAYWPADNDLYVKANFSPWSDLDAVPYMKEFLALDTGSLSDHLKKSTKGK